MFNFLRKIMSDSKNNTGINNSGDRNSGDRNSGDRNSGDRNSGYWNSGNWNSGDRNSGDRNSGNRNSGNRNSGYWNSGDRNSGDRNSGNGNSGNGNSGWFNTNEPNARFFNKDTDIKLSDFYSSDKVPSYEGFDICKWIPESEMTDQEKIDNPRFNITEGYLKTYTYKEAWKNFWAVTPEENKKKFLALPNFDAIIFEEITGINVNQKPDCEWKIVEIEGVKYILRKA